MEDRKFGYLDNPANGLGIVRARTLIGNLRIWDIPRTEEALILVIKEIGQSPIPGLYLLFDERAGKKVYVGQSENLKSRLIQHIYHPHEKIKKWERAIIINDARNAPQSDFNDENIRLTLENYLVILFKINRYNVLTSSSRTPTLSSTQLTLLESFKAEIIVLLTRKAKITKSLSEKSDNEIYNDEVRKLIEKKGFKVSSWGKVEAVLNNKKTFIRPGSPKKKGWQVTFRGNKSDSLKTMLNQGEGYLLMPRGPVLLVPLLFIRDFINNSDLKAFERDTIDIFIRFDDFNIAIVYKTTEIDVTKFSLLKYP
jgi:hypothetical protein